MPIANRPRDVHLVHYADLLGDLAGQMRRIAKILEITVDEDSWPRLTQAATFASMRARVAESVPATGGVLKNPAGFYRHGANGDGAALLTDKELATYERRAA